MLDARLRKLIDPPLDALGRRLAHLGVTANSVTWTGFLVGCGAWALLVLQSYPAALALILLNRLADGLDGAVARHARSEEHTSEVQSLMRSSYAVFCLKKKKKTNRSQT